MRLQPFIDYHRRVAAAMTFDDPKLACTHAAVVDQLSEIQGKAVAAYAQRQQFTEKRHVSRTFDRR
jgi:hypothetical protein